MYGIQETLAEGVYNGRSHQASPIMSNSYQRKILGKKKAVRALLLTVIFMLSICLPVAHGFTVAMASTKRRKSVCRYLQSRSLAEDRNQESENPVLTAQEHILQEILGIEPETQSEKSMRMKKRELLLKRSQREKKKSLLVALFGLSLGVLNYAWQYQNPVTSLSLLTEMQKNSADLNIVGNNGKPSIVDFWAPWCENCKSAAPTLAAIEEEYKGRVNFVMVNGDKGENWPIIERFGVDAIPHLAMVGSDGFVETALIGPIPRSVLEVDLDTMLENSENCKNQGFVKKSLPYTMFDAFRSSPDMRQLNFSFDRSPIVLGNRN